MNPFTRFLSQWSTDGRLQRFIHHWDALERMMVEIYRGKVTAQEAAPEFERIWSWLRVHYSEWEAQLEPFWRQTQAGGKPVEVDPFRLLLAIDQPADIPGAWRAMQHLPAAREALNQFLIAGAT